MSYLLDAIQRTVLTGREADLHRFGKPFEREAMENKANVRILDLDNVAVIELIGKILDEVIWR